MSVKFRAASVALTGTLDLDRCPHCGIAKPRLHRMWGAQIQPTKLGVGFVSVYQCSVCSDVILATAPKDDGQIIHLWPECATVDEAIPQRAAQFLRQAIDTMHAPAGAVVLAASSIDAMLKAKGYKDGSLNKRIDEAAAAGVMTPDMAKWAHDIRLDANDQRHADENAPLPNDADAKKVIEFAQALGQFLFVLPSRVAHGRAIPGGVTTTTTTTT